MKLQKSKKAYELRMIPTLVITLLVIAIVLGIGQTVLNSMQSSTNCAGNNFDEVSGLCYSCAAGDSWDAATADCLNSTGHSETAPTHERTLAFNATQEGIGGLNDLAEWQTTWAVIIAAAIVIGIISAYLFFKSK